MIINVLSKVLGFSERYFCHFFTEPGEVATAFQIASIVPYTILGFVISGFAANFIPMYTEFRINKEQNKLINFP